MKFNTYRLLVVFVLCFVTNSYAQRGNYPVTNGFSLFGGFSLFNINTNNFVTAQGTGFLGGLHTTADIPLRHYNISFGMQLSENNIDILGRPSLLSTEEKFINYKLFAAQIFLMWHAKIIKKHLTIDIGPMLQYNGELEFKNRNQEDYFINNYINLSAKDITQISQFNFNGAAGVSLGIKNFKLRGQYIYGFTNILNKLEKESLDTTGGNAGFKGNQSMLVLGATVSF